VLTAGLLRTRSLVINDYEFSGGTLLFHPSYVMAPDVIPTDAFRHMSRNVLTYRGIKEDVYAAGFSPDPSILERLRIKTSDVVVAVRPPAVEAHYHRQDSDTLFDATMNFLRRAKGVKVILLPRNDRQAAQLRTICRDLLDSGDMVIPDRAESGLNLVWYSDLVISGGGTMNREAAALGVPAYSIFRGAIGAVDRHLAEQGRLILLENATDLKSKVRLQQRVKTHPTASGTRQALSDIVEHIERIVVSGRAPRS
jgi:predicted glycosyltransferase